VGGGEGFLKQETLLHLFFRCPRVKKDTGEPCEKPGGNPAMDSHSTRDGGEGGRGEVVTLLVTSCYRTGTEQWH